VAEAFPGKEIMIGEFGWPSAGRMREGALPSLANQAAVVQDVLTLARRGNFRVNVIEAFDQPWKRALEGTVGGHWGFFDNDTRDFKFQWGAPVSSHPYWIWQALGGIAFAVLIFAAALRQGANAAGPVWLAVSGVAIVSGITIGWAIENASYESFGAGGVARSAALIFLALAVPPSVAAALVAGRALPQFSDILSSDVPLDGRGRALGWLAIGVTVIAVMTALGLAFDPRYRDFPYAPLSCAVVPLFILVVMSAHKRRGVAEITAAAVLLLCAAFMVWNETLANWQSLWLGGLFALLALTLMRARAARN
jgi:glucan 1,3-beta-glucosidase